METEKQSNKNWFDKSYKLFMLLPIILVVLCLIYLGSFYSQHGEFFFRDASLSGGTTITLTSLEGINIENLESTLKTKYADLSFRKLTDFRTGESIALVIESSATPGALKQDVESILNLELTEKNSSIEFTGSSLSGNFYKQLLVALASAFLLMSFVVFCLFGEKLKYKILSGILTFMCVLFLIKSMFIIAIPLAIILFGSYFILSLPSLAVIFAAFADIVMPLALIDFLGIRISSAGIAAFLMLIGYSVDTDILLTSRAIKTREGYVNERIYKSFKTGILMTITAICAVLPAFFIVTGLPDTFRQIFLILAMGLFADIINTWMTNTGIIKWYCVRHNIE
jgi:preprotein translocase subunit SecF